MSHTYAFERIEGVTADIHTYTAIGLLLARGKKRSETRASLSNTKILLVYLETRASLSYGYCVMYSVK